MATQHVTVQHADGLHARPAEMVAREAMRYQSQIFIVRGDQRVDAKSILDVLTLGAEQGAQLIVEAEGPDAPIAVDALARLVESDFAIDPPGA